MPWWATGGSGGRPTDWHNGARVAPPGQNVPPTTPPRCHNAEFSHLMLRSSRWSNPLLRSIFWPILCAPEHFFAYFKCSGALFCPFCALRSIAQRIKPNFACHTAANAMAAPLAQPLRHHRCAAGTQRATNCTSTPLAGMAASDARPMGRALVAACAGHDGWADAVVGVMAGVVSVAVVLVL